MHSDVSILRPSAALSQEVFPDALFHEVGASPPAKRLKSTNGLSILQDEVTTYKRKTGLGKPTNWWFTLQHDPCHLAEIYALHLSTASWGMCC